MGPRNAGAIDISETVRTSLPAMQLKESSDDPQTLARINAILFPREFTRLDGIVEILFSTAEEVSEDTVTDIPVNPQTTSGF